MIDGLSLAFLYFFTVARDCTCVAGDHLVSYLVGDWAWHDRMTDRLVMYRVCTL